MANVLVEQSTKKNLDEYLLNEYSSGKEDWWNNLWEKTNHLDGHLPNKVIDRTIYEK